MTPTRVEQLDTSAPLSLGRMQSTAPPTDETDTVSLKEKFGSNLGLPNDSPLFNKTVLFMAYKTIEAHPNITLNQLRWLFYTEYMISQNVVDGVVASLTSRTLFNCVTRYTPPGSTTVRLKVRSPCGLRKDFDEWMDRALRDSPEFSVFEPPPFSPRDSS